MPAPKGNQFWKARSKHGRDKIFKTPEDLWSACSEYFEWVEANPLYEMKVFCYQGEITEAEIPKMRAMTLDGLCFFLNIQDNTWRLYKERKDFMQVTDDAERMIYQQKFSGAAADLLNANIIARDLGLKDSTATEVTGKDGNPQEHKVIVSEMSSDEATQIYRDMIDGS